jgi:hypothetical protein
MNRKVHVQIAWSVCFWSVDFGWMVIRLLMNILGEEEACARGVFCKWRHMQSHMLILCKRPLCLSEDQGVCENIVRKRERRSGLWLDPGFTENWTLCRSIRRVKLIVESNTLLFGYNSSIKIIQPMLSRLSSILMSWLSLSYTFEIFH